MKNSQFSIKETNLMYLSLLPTFSTKSSFVFLDNKGAIGFKVKITLTGLSFPCLLTKTILVILSKNATHK